MIYPKVADAIRSSWSRETAFDPEAWSEERPATGQCAVTALVLHDEIGGRIAVDRSLHHYFNVLADDTIVDLTLEQFPLGTTVRSWEYVIRGSLLEGERADAARTATRYARLRMLVDRRLGRAQ